MNLRPYQRECINTTESQKPGAYLVQVATGMGKTVTSANIPRHGERMLILSHREELVEQPRRYFDCSYGIERASSRSHGEGVVSASVQSLVRRLDKFTPDEFGLIICDEAHHAAARTYRDVFDYFHPEKLIGFTVTPNQGGKVHLNIVFQDIIFQRDLRWGIQNGYLCGIYCRRVNIGFDLSAVHTRHGDYAPGELDEAMEGTADTIAQAYREMAMDAALIFAVSVHQAEEITRRISGAVVVIVSTKDRASIIQAFTAGEIPYIVNCMVLTEGINIPRVETIIVARPTQSETLYAQMVSRGLRLYPGKERLELIDCVGITGRASLRTTPPLLGINMEAVPAKKLEEIEGMLFELPDRVAATIGAPESWIKNVELVDLWAQERRYQLHDVNWFKIPDGSLVCRLMGREFPSIPCPDALGMVMFEGGKRMKMQEVLDSAYRYLVHDYQDCKYLWDLGAMRRWGQEPTTQKQLEIIYRRCKGFDATGLTKGAVSQILNRLFSEPTKGKGRRRA